MLLVYRWNRVWRQSINAGSDSYLPVVLHKHPLLLLGSINFPRLPTTSPSPGVSSPVERFARSCRMFVLDRPEWDYHERHNRAAHDWLRALLGIR